jgi:transglutaminase-like putative cysteine protease
MAALYRIEHVTRYRYASTVAASQHVAYLRPRELAYQHVQEYRLEVEPAPAHATQRTDYFGNVADHCQLLVPHVELVVSSHSVVEVLERFTDIDPVGNRPWDIDQFTFSSPYAQVGAETEAFARPSFPVGRAVLDGAVDLMHRIHDQFSFDPSSTNVATPVTRVLEEHRGVCQDFAHVHVACMRSMGLPARYVSGYLLTDPPPGQPRLIGADASHAWVAVFCPQQGWVDLDPTNGVVVGQRHVTLAWGRDYGDVSPLRGVLMGGAEHTLSVGVSVIPLEQPVPDS